MLKFFWSLGCFFSLDMERSPARGEWSLSGAWVSSDCCRGWASVSPTGIKNTYPFEGQGANRGVVVHTRVSSQVLRGGAFARGT